MKRTLQVVEGPVVPPTRHVMLGATRIAIDDGGTGEGSARFAQALIDAGAQPVELDAGVQPDVRVVVRGTATTRDARLRSRALEERADLVLGSARPAFAAHFASACAVKASH